MWAGRRHLRDPAFGAKHRALGAVEDVPLGDAHLPAQDELFLDDVLDGLDRDRVETESARPEADPVRDPPRGLGVERQRQERLADRDLDLAGVPRDDMAGAPLQTRLAAGRRCVRSRVRAAHHEGLRHVERALLDQRRLDQHGEVGCGHPRRVAEQPEPRDHCERRVAYERLRRRDVDLLPAGGCDRPERLRHPAARVAQVVRLVESRQHVLHRELGQLVGRQHRGALHLQVIEDFVEVDDHDPSSFQSSSSATRARAEAFWYSVTRPSKKFCSLRMSISSASHGSGFSIRPTSGSSPTPSRRRSAM